MCLIIAQFGGIFQTQCGEGEVKQKVCKDEETNWSSEPLRQLKSAGQSFRENGTAQERSSRNTCIPYMCIGRYSISPGREQLLENCEINNYHCMQRTEICLSYNQADYRDLTGYSKHSVEFSERPSLKCRLMQPWRKGCSRGTLRKF